jgi:hypothetical protein
VWDLFCQSGDPQVRQLSTWLAVAFVRCCRRRFATTRFLVADSDVWHGVCLGYSLASRQLVFAHHNPAAASHRADGRSRVGGGGAARAGRWMRSWWRVWWR